MTYTTALDPDHPHKFNQHRLHSALDYVPPIEHEQAYYRQDDPQQQPLPGEPALH